jgi:hypothetical protein
MDEKPVVIHRKTLSRKEGTHETEIITRRAQQVRRLIDKEETRSTTKGGREEREKKCRLAIRVFLKYEPPPNNHQQRDITTTNRAVRPSLTMDI